MPTRIPAELPDAFLSRFWGKVQKTESCWLWTGLKQSKGYGQISHMGKMIRVHRVSYTLRHGEIPDGLQLDHLCRTRHCVNPDHLEAVSCRENLLRGETVNARNAAKTHCHNGHPFSAGNTTIRKGKRICKACVRQRSSAKGD